MLPAGLANHAEGAIADPRDLAAAWRALGQQLAALRKAVGHTQQSLAPLTLYGRSTIANVETGHQRVTRDFWVRCDRLLDAGGTLVGEYDRIEGVSVSSARAVVTRQHRGQSGLVMTSPPDTGYSLLAPDLRHAEAMAAAGTRTMIWAPPGQFYPGVEIDAQVHPATDLDRILAQVPPGYGDNPFLHRPRRGLVVGAVPGPDELRLYGLDARQARLRLRGTAPDSPLPMARPYLIDPFTSAIIWAVANLDEAL
ncbi:MAG: helix-turn-helix domain-containing protein, partial [Micromonosporaceae bacterium]|nr:helix-turn-helix domain-containing protein [Micromonosporaceae bacterium]